MWSGSAGDKNLEKFRELRFSYVYDLCKSLLNEFGAELE